MKKETIFEIIREMPLFGSVSNEMLKSLADSMTSITLPGGQFLLKQGDPADCLYILARGRMIVTIKNQDGADKKIGEIGVGDFVGEMSLLTDLPRSATVQAVRDCELIVISKKLFSEMIAHHTEATMKVVSQCVKRLLPNFTEKRNGIKSICLLPCDKKFEREAFTESLMIALQQYASVKVIHPEDPDVKNLMKNDVSELYTWLANLEMTHDLCIYCAELEVTDFTRIALAHADKVVRLTTDKPDYNHSLMDYLNQTDNLLAEKYLIIQHKNSDFLPHGTRELLNNLPCSQHFHVGGLKGVDRFARYLLGKSITICFSGGGFRGIAHQGLIQALDERNIPIDMVGGTSFGALPSVFCSLGISPDEIIEVWHPLVERMKKVVDYTLPIAALSKGQILFELLSEAMPPTVHMEDLWIPAFTVSTDLAQFSTVMHRSGPAWEAVRASLSIPGIFPPVIQGDSVLVDGASLNNLPVDLMKSINNQGTVIASLASGKPNLAHYKGYENGLSGWRFLPEIFSHPEHPLVPSIIETMLTASLASSHLYEEKMAALADYTIDMGVGHYPLMDVGSWLEMRDTGYQSAIQYLDKHGITRESLGL